MEINERLEEVLRVELSSLGLEIEKDTPSSLSVLQNNQPIVFIQDHGEIQYPAHQQSLLAGRIPAIVANIWEMENAYRQAP